MRDPNTAVILEVSNGAHWVTPVRWSYIHACWIIHDPWFGDEAPLSRYGNTWSGAAYFVRK